MKSTLRNIIIAAVAIFIALPAYAINYPTYKGPSVERNTKGQDIEVPLRDNPLPKPTSVNIGEGYSQLNNSSSATNGSIYLYSDKHINNYGGGAQGGNSGSVKRGSSRGGVSGGASAGSFSLPRIKSVTKGSKFENEDGVLADNYAPSALRGDGTLPPPPGPGSNTDENQLPIGNGLGLLLLCCTIYGIKKKNKNNDFEDRLKTD